MIYLYQNIKNYNIIMQMFDQFKKLYIDNIQNDNIKLELKKIKIFCETKILDDDDYKKKEDLIDYINLNIGDDFIKNELIKQINYESISEIEEEFKYMCIRGDEESWDNFINSESIFLLEKETIEIGAIFSIHYENVIGLQYIYKYFKDIFDEIKTEILLVCASNNRKTKMILLLLKFGADPQKIINSSAYNKKLFENYSNNNLDSKNSTNI